MVHGSFLCWFGLICGFTCSHLTKYIVCVCRLGGGETWQYRGAYETFRGSAGGEEPGTAQGQHHLISLNYIFFRNCILAYYVLYLQYAYIVQNVHFLFIWNIQIATHVATQICSIKQHSSLENSIPQCNDLPFPVWWRNWQQNQLWFLSNSNGLFNWTAKNTKYTFSTFYIPGQHLQN